MNITKEVTPITWKTMPEPDYYPCHFCDTRKAVKHLQLKIGVLEINLVVCESCSQLPANEIHNKIKTKKGGE